MLDIKKLIKSFKYAGQGIIYAIKTEQNLKIHILIAIIVFIFSFILDLRKTEILILLLTIAMVISAELFNTVVESIVDLITEDYHPLAKIAKDISAGAVLFTAIISILIGLIIFLEPTITFIKTLIFR